MDNLSVKILPVIPMRKTVIFPNTPVELDVGRGFSLAAVEYAELNGKLVFLTKQIDSEKENPQPEDLCLVGDRKSTRLNSSHP